MLKEKLKMMNGVLENGNYQLGQFQFIALFKNEKNRIRFAIDCKFDPVFCVYVTIAFHDGNNPK